MEIVACIIRNSYCLLKELSWNVCIFESWIFQNMIWKCLEILKIFSKNSNSWYIVIHFRGDSNHFPYETIL